MAGSMSFWTLRRMILSRIRKGRLQGTQKDLLELSFIYLTD